MRNPDIRHRIDADAILGERPGPGDDPRDAETWKELAKDAFPIVFAYGTCRDRHDPNGWVQRYLAKRDGETIGGDQ